MEKIKKYLPELLFFTAVLTLFLYKIQSSYYFDSDFGRDLMWMYDILHGKITLLGPKLSFGGYHVGPYYYYLFAPFLFLSSFLPHGVLIANAIISAFFLTLVFYSLRTRINVIFALFSSTWFAITAYILYTARNPGNAFSYISALLFYIIFLMFGKTKPTLKSTFFYGLSTGLLMNFHPVSLLVTVPLTVSRLFLIKKSRLRQNIVFFFGALTTLVPIFLFEARHDFIMFKNTFITKSYQAFLNPYTPVSMTIPSANPFKNLFVMNSLLSSWVIPAFLVLLLVLLLVFFLSKKDKNNISLFVSFVLSLILYSILFRFQATFFYLFPLLIFLQVSIVYFLSVNKQQYRVFILLFLLILSLGLFPVRFYDKTERSFKVLYSKTQKAVGIIDLPKKNFNIFVIRKTPIAAVGYEYRYILRLLGYLPDDEFSYRSSSYLLIISEKGEQDFYGSRSWELDQFGKKILIKKFSDADVVFYLFRKADSFYSGSFLYSCIEPNV